MSKSTPIGRMAAVLALLAAIVIVLLTVAGGGDTYKVTAQFENASQLVTGNTVSVAGVAAGTIDEIALADDGQAEVSFSVSEEYAPLPQGTHATIRSQSLSGIANRYIALELPGDDSAGEIEDGGVIEQVNTTSEVDLDQLFNTLNEKTVRDFKKVLRGFARSYDGVGPEANEGFHYLNPFLSTSRRVFGELNADQQTLEDLIVDGASLTDALSERSDDISGLISNASTATGAIARRETELASAIGQLPGFMRQFNTTAVNLRAALDDVDPLITASRPVAKKLQPFVSRLRGFARDAVPTVRDLDGIVRRRGSANDLIELTRLQNPLAKSGVGPTDPNGIGDTRGALPQSAEALGEGLDELQFFRPYITTEGISGWFDDFSHSGFPDAIGGVGRISTTFNAFTFGLLPGGVPSVDFLSPPLDAAGLAGALDIDNMRRCPGSNERGQTPEQLTYNGTIDCDPTITPPGP